MNGFDLHDWLISEVGVPDKNVKERMAMYSKLSRMSIKYGDPCLAVVAECWAYAKAYHLRRPVDEYFVYLCRVRLSDAGYWDDLKKFRKMDHDDLIREGFPTTKDLPLFAAAEPLSPQKQIEFDALTSEQKVDYLKTRARARIARGPAE